MANFDPTVLVGASICLVFVVVGLVWIVFVKHNKLSHKTNRKFGDWASIMTPIGGGLALILPIIQKNPLMTGISLSAGAVTLLIPFAYTAIFPSDSRVRYFLSGGTLMVLSLLVQLVTAANLADDLSVPDIPNGFLYFFRALMGVGAIVVLLYAGRSLIDIINKPIIDNTSTKLDE